MSRATLIVLAAVPLIGLAVYAGGVAVAPEGRNGILWGVLIGVVIQLLLLGSLAVAFPDKPLAAYGVGLVARMVVVVAAALVLVPATRLPPAPLLLSLVSVLFATTLLEPVALAAGRRTKS